MNYRLTILNGVSVFWMAASFIYTIVNFRDMNSGGGQGLFVMILTILYGAAGLVADFVMQYYIREKRRQLLASIAATIILFGGFFAIIPFV